MTAKNLVILLIYFQNTHFASGMHDGCGTTGEWWSSTTEMTTAQSGNSRRPTSGGVLRACCLIRVTSNTVFFDIMHAFCYSPSSPVNIRTHETSSHTVSMPQSQLRPPRRSGISTRTIIISRLGVSRPCLDTLHTVLQCEPVKTDLLAPHFLHLLLAFNNSWENIRNACNRLGLNVATRPSHYFLLIPPFNFFCCPKLRLLI